MKARTALLAGALAAANVLGATAPALADSGVERSVVPEHYEGTMRAPDLDDCVGYAAQVYENRDGEYHLTTHTKGSNTGASNVEGTVFATFEITPVSGSGVVYEGTYREHSAGTFKTVDGEDQPFPSGTYVITGNGTGSDGSTIRFTSGGHFVSDKRTGEEKRTVYIGKCRVS